MQVTDWLFQLIVIKTHSINTNLHDFSFKIKYIFLCKYYSLLKKIANLSYLDNFQTHRGT